MVLSLSRLSDDAEPAKASSSSRRLPQTRRIPPWIEERRAREQRIIAQAQAMGLPIPPRPRTRKHARSVDAAIQHFETIRVKTDDSSIPF